MLTLAPRLVAALFALLVLSACATTERSEARREALLQREAQAAQMRVELLERILLAEAKAWAVLDPLMRAGAHYRSEETTAYLGAVFVSEVFFNPALVREVRKEGFGPYVSVLRVFPDSPADQAGLRAGDQLLQVNGREVPSGERAGTYAAKRLKHALAVEKENQLLVRRGEELLELTIVPEEGLYYGVAVVASDGLGFHADGELLWLGLETIENLVQGEDLNCLLAFALAKNVMRHPEQRGKNAFLGQLLDVAAMASGVNTGGLFGSMGSQAYSQAFDVEADLIALYLLASVGYSIDSYPEFWKAALLEQDGGLELKAGSEERLEKMRQVIASIRAKQAAGEPIFPEEYLQGDVSELE